MEYSGILVHVLVHMFVHVLVHMFSSVYKRKAVPPIWLVQKTNQPQMKFLNIAAIVAIFSAFGAYAELLTNLNANVDAVFTNLGKDTDLGKALTDMGYTAGITAFKDLKGADDAAKKKEIEKILTDYDIAQKMAEVKKAGIDKYRDLKTKKADLVNSKAFTDAQIDKLSASGSLLGGDRKGSISSQHLLDILNNKVFTAEETAELVRVNKILKAIKGGKFESDIVPKAAEFKLTEQNIKDIKDQIAKDATKIDEIDELKDILAGKKKPDAAATGSGSSDTSSDGILAHLQANMMLYILGGTGLVALIIAIVVMTRRKADSTDL